MNFRILAGMIALAFLLSGCFSSSSSSGGMSDEDRAAAAASASVLSGALDDAPDDDDDDGDGGAGGNSLMGQFARASAQSATHCDSGTHSEGVDVATSRFLESQVEVDTDYYQDCVTGAGTEWESYMDGFSASGWTNDSTIMYARWAAEPEAPLNDLGFFTMESAWGNWRFSGEMHTCDECGSAFFANEMFVRWEIDGGDTLATIGWGRPDNFLVATGNMVGDTDLEQTIDGYMMMSVEGTPCDLEVEYTTHTALHFENVGTASERIIAGELTIDLVGGPSYNAEFIDGQLYINGSPVDMDQRNPCDIDLM